MSRQREKKGAFQIIDNISEYFLSMCMLANVCCSHEKIVEGFPPPPPFKFLLFILASTPTGSGGLDIDRERWNFGPSNGLTARPTGYTPGTESKYWPAPTSSSLLRLLRGGLDLVLQQTKIEQHSRPKFLWQTTAASEKICGFIFSFTALFSLVLH